MGDILIMENGKIVIKLDKYLKENNISRSSLSKNGRLRYDTILSYCRNEVTRLDTDTLVRLCSTLNCKLNDIVEYVQEK
mgnify:CR=1 FL=1